MQKRPVYIKRDLYTSKRDLYTFTCLFICACLFICPCLLGHSHLCRYKHCAKETYIHQKRPIYIKRDLYTSNETKIQPPVYLYVHVSLVIDISVDTNTVQKRPIYIKRDLYTSKETYIHQNETYIYSHVCKWLSPWSIASQNLELLTHTHTYTHTHTHFRSSHRSFTFPWSSISRDVWMNYRKYEYAVMLWKKI